MADASAKLDAFGIDAICDMIAAGKSLTEIARKAKVSIGTLRRWFEADTARSARARETRAKTAQFWDEKAEAEIRNAKSTLGMAKARELAHHYRWRASKIAPAEYGEKLDLTAKVSPLDGMTTDEQRTLLAALEALASGAQPADDGTAHAPAAEGEPAKD